MSKVRAYWERVVGSPVEHEPPDAYLVRSHAIVREAARRTVRLTACDEQLIAAMAMHERFVAQMDTGEGKTLAAVFTVFLRAAGGHGAHVLTFNDYLARVDEGDSILIAEARVPLVIAATDKHAVPCRSGSRVSSMSSRAAFTTASTNTNASST